MRKILRKNTSLYSRLQAALVCTALLAGLNAVTSCSGYGSEYDVNKDYSDLFDDYYSSSSYDRYSSSNDKYYSSSNRYSSDYEIAALSSSSYFDSTTMVKTVADLDSTCTDGEKKTVVKDSSLYRCVFGVWFKEVKTIPECTQKKENETFYKNAAYICLNEKWRELTAIEAKLGV